MLTPSAGRLASSGATDPGEDARGFQLGDFTDSTRSSMSGAVEFWQDWDLDGVNNWSKFYGNDSTGTDREHSALNEIVSVGTDPITHDPNGNMLEDGTRKLSWDAFGRLREVRRVSG